MLGKIKHWLLSVGEGEGGDGSGSAAEQRKEPSSEEPSDAPASPPSAATAGEEGEGEGESKRACACRNCFELMARLQECAVCLEPLSSPSCRGLTACFACGNVACRTCADKLPRCPFCRAEGGLHCNQALQRLFFSLDFATLPQDSLPDNCVIRCPHKRCAWAGRWRGQDVGDEDAFVAHLSEAHLATILQGNAVTLDIEDFTRKSEASRWRSRRYTVLLRCHDRLVQCKIGLEQCRVRVSLAQSEPVDRRQRALDVHVEMRSTCCVAKRVRRLGPGRQRATFHESAYAFLCSPPHQHDVLSITIDVQPL